MFKLRPLIICNTVIMIMLKKKKIFYRVVASGFICRLITQCSCKKQSLAKIDDKIMA